MSMQDKLRAKFLEQFMATARERVTACQSAVSGDDAGVAASEMHSLAGECSILGFDEIGKEARGAEAEAKKWLAGASASRVKCGRALRTISRALDSVATANVAAPKETSPVAGGNDNERVLIIDDSEIVAVHLQECLEEAGLQVHWTDALDPAIAHATQEQPAVVLVDANIPGVDTRQLIEALREASASSKLLLVSGLSEEELAPLSKQLRLDGFVSKQSGVDAIVVRVQQCLKATPSE
jgi:CheY-like chemotaxis protein